MRNKINEPAPQGKELEFETYAKEYANKGLTSIDINFSKKEYALIMFVNENREMEAKFNPEYLKWRINKLRSNTTRTVLLNALSGGYAKTDHAVRVVDAFRNRIVNEFMYGIDRILGYTKVSTLYYATRSVFIKSAMAFFKGLKRVKRKLNACQNNFSFNAGRE